MSDQTSETLNESLNAAVDRLGATALEWKARAEDAEAQLTSAHAAREAAEQERDRFVVGKALEHQRAVRADELLAAEKQARATAEQQARNLKRAARALIAQLTDCTPHQVQSASDFLERIVKWPAGKMRADVSRADIAQLLAWYGALRFRSGRDGTGGTLEQPGEFNIIPRSEG